MKITIECDRPEQFIHFLRAFSENLVRDTVVQAKPQIGLSDAEAKEYVAKEYAREKVLNRVIVQAQDVTGTVQYFQSQAAQQAVPSSTADAKGPKPERDQDARFAKLATIRQVIAACQEIGLDTREDILGRCRDLKKHGACAVLSVIPEEDLEERIFSGCDALSIL